MQQSVRNVCAKFKVDPLSRFRTGARQVFTTHKLFSSEIPLTLKLQHQIPFKHIFWSSYYLTISKISFEIFDIKKIDTQAKKVNIWIPLGSFPFFISFFYWNEKTRNFQEKTPERSEAVASAYNFIKKEALPQVFSCECCKISKNIFSNRTPPVAASSERWKIVKRIIL